MSGQGKCLGSQKIASGTLASAVSLTIPAGTQYALLQADTANVRYTLDGTTTPTSSVGNIIIAGAHQPLMVSNEMGLGAMKVIAESGSPNLNIHYFGTA